MEAKPKSRLIAVSAAALLAGLAACSSPQTGVLTGRAWPCAGPSHILHNAQLWVFRGSTVVERSSVPGGSTYRLVLPSGQYRIANTGNLGGPTNAVVVGGQTTRVGVPDNCK